MISPQLLPLNAPDRAVGDVLFCRAVVDHMNGKFASQIPGYTEALNRFASWPKPDLLQTVSRQICATDANRVPQKPHEQRPIASHDGIRIIGFN
jgi:hypothetical protein